MYRVKISKQGKEKPILYDVAVLTMEDACSLVDMESRDPRTLDWKIEDESGRVLDEWGGDKHV